mmetsp:Transcript_4027/g.14321  ORF Transcript_4027/g.14321 Transcript_4027/m.14321 type:complete len:906 (-) Transcript_4027:203-2920(-)
MASQLPFSTEAQQIRKHHHAIPGPHVSLTMERLSADAQVIFESQFSQNYEHQGCEAPDPPESTHQPSQERRATTESVQLSKESSSHKHSVGTKSGGKVILIFCDGTGLNMLSQLQESIATFGDDDDGMGTACKTGDERRGGEHDSREASNSGGHVDTESGDRTVSSSRADSRDAETYSAQSRSKKEAQSLRKPQFPRWSNITRMFLALQGTVDDPAANFFTPEEAGGKAAFTRLAALSKEERLWQQQHQQLLQMQRRGQPDDDDDDGSDPSEERLKGTELHQMSKTATTSPSTSRAIASSSTSSASLAKCTDNEETLCGDSLRPEDASITNKPREPPTGGTAQQSKSPFEYVSSELGARIHGADMNSQDLLSKLAPVSKMCLREMERTLCLAPSEAIADMVYTLEASDTNIGGATRRDTKPLFPTQLALYSAGMGTSYTGEPEPEDMRGFWDFRSWFLKKRWQLAFSVCGGMFGYGIQEQVSTCYKFLCRAYEPGDKIMLFGFSRGGYIVRALNGMVAQVGLLKPQHLDRLDLVESLYNVRLGTGYIKAARSVGIPWSFWELLGFRLKLWAAFFCCRSFDFASVFEKVLIPFRQNFCVSTDSGRPTVYFTGVFDTVKSYGFSWLSPALAFKRMKAGLVTGRHPLHAYHAVASTEKRYLFRPLLWNEVEVLDDRQKVEQVFFRGVHGDVGGAAPSDRSEANPSKNLGQPGSHGLAPVPFLWMLHKAVKCANDEEVCDLMGVSREKIKLKGPFQRLVDQYDQVMDRVGRAETYQSPDIQWFYANPLLHERRVMKWYYYALAFPAIVKEALLSCNIKAFVPSRFRALLRGHILHFKPASKRAKAKAANTVKIHKSMQAWLDVYKGGISEKTVCPEQVPLLSKEEALQAARIQRDLNALSKHATLQVTP